MFEQAKKYLVSFASYGGRRLVLAAILVFSAALLEGVGILLLVPVLEVFSGTESSGVLAAVDQVFAQFSIDSDFAKLVFVLIAFLALLVLRNVIVWRRDITQALLSMGFVDHWRETVFFQLARAPWRTITEFRQTDIEHSLMSDVNRLALGTTQSLQGATAFVMLLVQIGIALFLSPILSALVISFGVVIGFLLWPLIRKSREIGRSQTRRGRNLFAVLDQFLSGLKLAKVQNADDTYVGTFKEAVTALRTQLVQFQRDRAFARLLFQVLAGVLACLVILIGLFVLETSPTILIVFLFVQTRLTGPFQTLQTGIQSFANMLPAFEGVLALQDRLREGADHAKGDTPLPELDKGTPLFSFKELSFSYEKPLRVSSTVSTYPWLREMSSL
ncbi:MAG: ABC transporter transmembrane domain-containing protein [Pseudomonadota bacterium]